MGRPENRCLTCGHNWSPRGHDLARRCPDCGSRDVQLKPGASASGVCGCLLLAVLALLAVRAWSPSSPATPGPVTPAPTTNHTDDPGSAASAEVPANACVFVLTNGRRIPGTVASEDSDEYVVKIPGGAMRLPKDSVADIESASAGDFLRVNFGAPETSPDVESPGGLEGPPSGSKTVHVNGYRRRDGTYVHGYDRRPSR
jgi:predicted  nucleic acid-binding Zn-ribbon protein